MATITKTKEHDGSCETISRIIHFVKTKEKADLNFKMIERERGGERETVEAEKRKKQDRTKEAVGNGRNERDGELLSLRLW